jgi:putative membrane protein
MNAVAIYPWIKALHVAAVLGFVAGTFAQALFLSTMPLGSSAESARRFRQVGWSVTTLAPIIAVPSGLALATLGHWFPAPWIVLKTALVVALLGIHGFQSGQLRRLAAGEQGTYRPLQHVLLAIVAIIALLVVLKPTLR